MELHVTALECADMACLMELPTALCAEHKKRTEAAGGGDESGGEEQDASEQLVSDELRRQMGFGAFGTTKGTHVPGNDVYVVSILKKRKYRCL